MSVVLQYRLSLPEQKLTVSNNVFRGEYVLDAEIEVEQASGVPGSTFEAAIENLPESVIEKLSQAIGEGKSPVPIKLELGYFEGPFAPVMDGLVQDLEVKAKDGKLITTLKGGETATQRLTDKQAKQALPAGLTAEEAVKLLLKSLEDEPGRPAIERKIGRELVDKLPDGVRQDKLLTMLGEVAKMARSELYVVDGTIWMGRPLERPDYVPPQLTLDRNLASFEPFDKKLPEEVAAFRVLPASKAKGFRFKIAGDPRLRPGHRLSAAVKGFEATSGLRFRATSLKHSFGASGYLCEGTALLSKPGDINSDRDAKAASSLSAADVARLVTELLDKSIRQRPSVEMGQVEEHHPATGGEPPPAGELVPGPHRASLFHGQEVGKEILPAESQPSVRAEVRQQDDDKGIFKDKPLLSPFAWHKCGLVVPVYKGMKAVLLHNLGRAEDPIVAGYVWSEKPAIAPPSAQAGDWWLCLPADYDGTAPPTNATKATNDLTGSDGKRVIEAKGLKITIGASQLKAVGTRPEAAGDDELVIEHASGSFIKLGSDGKVTIKASEVSIEGDVKLKGSLDIQ